MIGPPQYRHADTLPCARTGFGGRVGEAQVIKRELPERWRKPALVAGSVVFHVVVLALLGLQTVEIGETPSQPQLPIVFLDIAPRPMLKDETARVRPTPTEATPDRLTLPDQAATSRALPLRDPREEEQAQGLPTAPSPRVGVPAPGVPAPPASAVAGGWTVRPETQGDRVQRGLIGSNLACRTPQLLTPAEQARCDERMANAANSTPSMRGSGDPDTDSRFGREGARALAEYEARRRPLAGGTGNVGPQDGPGSNFGMGVAGAHLDPSLRPDSTSNVRTRRDGQRSSGQPLVPGGGGFARE